MFLGRSLVALILAFGAPAYAAISQTEFEALTDRAIYEWRPMAQAHGATLVSRKLWNSDFVNAIANRNGLEWYLEMHGGFARQPEMNADIFMLILCHELGHHFGGYVFKWDFWISSEGQADYFSTQVCVRKIWGAEPQKNATFRPLVGLESKSRCDSVWREQAQRDLCYRIATQSLTYTRMAARIKSENAPSLEARDPRRVPDTRWGYPSIQCRLDTLIAGSLCTREFDVWKIPSLNHPQGVQSPEAERDAQPYSCFAQDGFTEGVRPRCWFKPAIN